MPENIDVNHTLSQIRYVAELLNDTITIKRHSIKNGQYWRLDDDMEGISAFGIGSPPNTPTMMSCLDNEVIFDTDDTCNDDST